MFPFLMLDFLCNSENSLPALPAFSGAFLANMSYVRPPAPLVPSSPQPHWHCSSWALASLPSEMGEPSTQSYSSSSWRLKKQDNKPSEPTYFLLLKIVNCVNIHPWRYWCISRFIGFRPHLCCFIRYVTRVEPATVHRYNRKTYQWDRSLFRPRNNVSQLQTCVSTSLRTP